MCVRGYNTRKLICESIHLDKGDIGPEEQSCQKLKVVDKRQQVNKFQLLALLFCFFKEMQSGRSQSMVRPIPQRIQSFQAADTRGKHRIQAELKRLEQEARFLEEELEQIERMEKASAACKEMFNNVQSKPDPLLPITNGPINPVWDQWFEGPQEAQGCRCWIL
ncbi:hypothetical protein V6N13_037449 [Hibiscus sabdariffa]|uniref:G protein gamma domain-containing protein n=1 Tax=Hibiscus sabdariffa TaxID=183260 RepID=A0ABR2E8V0_9ROSI